ncbi:seven-hairpin glycosidase [Pseudovirgaria hyperparasitica]|uniref:alpha-1,2-Mannosidase n=1 Tax=Pseudovirgaria hyperparasitica TaxID=470096 RepID=A0A6A6WLZ9_9PEZI|nr:seven-hairpin glycosidase [Pseudovirgaria hyperparasitica]KAF2763224.1 seven-hairpin glycosidase [Pseudovirgaria hyperparasitica]
MPPGFRRSSSWKRNPTHIFKFIAAAFVLFFYFIFTVFGESPHAPRNGARIQWDGFINGTGVVDEPRAARVVEAMKHTFWTYKEHAWGADMILPVSGHKSNKRGGWGATIVDSASTLAIMELWEELELAVNHIIEGIDFTKTDDLVDPFETTIRHLGGMVSVVDLWDAGIIPKKVISREKRDKIVKQAVILGQKLGPAYDSPTGLPWPRVDFMTSKGVPDPRQEELQEDGKPRYAHPTIGPARAGSNILENRVLSRLTHNPIYFQNSTLACYYEYLLKITLLTPQDRYTPMYKKQWERAVHSLRDNLASRNRPSATYMTQHLFLGKRDDDLDINTQSQLACFAAGNILLGGAHLQKPSFIALGKALVEACHHTYASTPTSIGPEKWAWSPKFGVRDATVTPETERQQAEWANAGFWAINPSFRLRPEYVESLFYAWRITGEARYREWAWDAFVAIETHCKARYGYAGLKDVMVASSADGARDEAQMDESESFWHAETLKYFWLIFADSRVASLDRWVFSTEGHLFRMIR